MADNARTELVGLVRAFQRLAPRPWEIVEERDELYVIRNVYGGEVHPEDLLFYIENLEKLARMVPV